jgi:hypothetical protein
MTSGTNNYSDIKWFYIAGSAWHFCKSNSWLFDYQRTNCGVSTIPREDRANPTLEPGFEESFCFRRQSKALFLWHSLLQFFKPVSNNDDFWGDFSCRFCAGNATTF